MGLAIWTEVLDATDLIMVRTVKGQSTIIVKEIYRYLLSTF